MYEGQNDPYIDASTGVLKNLLGISNAQELEKIEASLAYGRSLDLDMVVPPVPPFDRSLGTLLKGAVRDVRAEASGETQGCLGTGQNVCGLFRQHGEIRPAAASGRQDVPGHS